MDNTQINAYDAAFKIKTIDQQPVGSIFFLLKCNFTLALLQCLIIKILNDLSVYNKDLLFQTGHLQLIARLSLTYMWIFF